MRPARRSLAVDVAAGVIAAGLVVPQMLLLAAVLTAAAGGGARRVPAVDTAALVAIFVARATLAAVVESSGRRVAATVMSGLRADLVEARLRSPWARPREGTAELAACAVQGVDGLEAYFARYLPQCVQVVVLPLLVVSVVAAVDPQSAMIMLVTVPVIPVFMALVGRSAAARSRANLRALAALSTHFLDVVRGLPTLRAFNRGRAQLPMIREISDRYRRTSMSTLRLAFLSGLVLDLAATLSTALVAVDLGVRLVGGTVALRPALTVLLLVPELYAPPRALGAQFHASQDGLAAARRLLDVLDDHRPRNHLPAARPFGQISLRGVTVRYPGRPADALHRLDLDIRPGEVLAVTGASGAGKTTLGRVLVGLTRPDDGVMTIGTWPLTDGDIDGWRRQVAWASQHPVMVAGTVAENIALGRPDAGEAAIEGAARWAGAHRFVEALPDGYATVVGPGGRGLSAGQRRRLGLARAVLRDTPLLVLDEPTVHLDAAAARAIAANIGALGTHRTVVVLTHDEELAERADRRVCLRSPALLVGGG